MYTGELFEMDEIDQLLMQDGTAIDLMSLRPDWLNLVGSILADSTIVLPADTYMQTGSRKGIHTEYLGHLLSEVQYLQRAYPDATW